MKTLNTIYVLGLLFFALVSCDKNSDEIDPDVSPTVEVKEEILFGTWKLEREDNGIFVTTSFNLRSDYTCTYTQTISSDKYYEDITEEDYKIELNGKWSCDKKSAIISFELKDIEGNGTFTLKANFIKSSSSSIINSFKITDGYSANDDFCFTK